jgi:hypothetical protein
MPKITRADIGRRFIDRSGNFYTVFYPISTGFGIDYMCETDTGERVLYGSTGQRLKKEPKDSPFDISGGSEDFRFDMWADETREQTIERARREFWNTVEHFAERMRERLNTPAYSHLSDEDKEWVFSREYDPQNIKQG